MSDNASRPSILLVDDDEVFRNRMARAFVERGYEVSWEYPGALAITISPKYEMWTALHGYHYGSMNVLDEDGTWQPMETGEWPDPEGLTEDSRNTQKIVAAWAACIDKIRAEWLPKQEV